MDALVSTCFNRIASSAANAGIVPAVPLLRPLWQRLPVISQVGEVQLTFVEKPQCVRLAFRGAVDVGCVEVRGQLIDLGLRIDCTKHVGIVLLGSDSPESPVRATNAQTACTSVSHRCA